MAHGHSGMTPAERAVMDLWDTGHGFPAIARVLGKPRKQVERIVSTFHTADPGNWQGDIRAGSARLLTALQAAA